MLNRSPVSVRVCPAMALSCPGAAHVPRQVATVTSRPFLWVSSYQQLNSSCQQDSGCAMPSRNRGGWGFVPFGLRTLQHVQRHEQVSSVPRTRMADTRAGCGQGSLTIWAITECWFDKNQENGPLGELWLLRKMSQPPRNAVSRYQRSGQLRTVAPTVPTSFHRKTTPGVRIAPWWAASNRKPH